MDSKLHPVNARMKNLRIRLGYAKPARFAKMLGVSIPRWCNVEAGHPLTHKLVLILREKIPGLSWDYIYEGDANNLGDELRAVLGEKPAARSVKGLPLGPDFDKPMKNNDGYRPRATRRKVGGG